MLLPSISPPSEILKLRHKMNLWVTDTYMYPLNLLRSLLGISQMMVFWKNSGSNKVFCKRKHTGSEHQIQRVLEMLNTNTNGLGKCTSPNKQINK